MTDYLQVATFANWLDIEMKLQSMYALAMKFSMPCGCLLYGSSYEQFVKCWTAQVHNPDLCFQEALPSTLANGEKTDEAFTNDTLKNDHAMMGWTKTFVGIEVHKLGYQMLLLDSDALYFSNPLDAFDPKAHIAVTNDCADDYHPRHNRSKTFLPCLLICILLLAQAIPKHPP